jgi:hypothetical protein
MEERLVDNFEAAEINTDHAFGVLGACDDASLGHYLIWGG